MEQVHNGRYSFQDKYAMDCVGWVSFAIHHCWGLGGEEFTYFVTPQNGICDAGVNIFEVVNGNILPGDILVSPGSPHVMIYVGNDMIVDSAEYSAPPAVIVDSLSNGSWWQRDYDYAVRITQEAAAGLTADNVTSVFGESTGASDSSLSFQQPYEYYGMPITGQYAGHISFGDWLFNGITQFFDYLVGILMSILRIPILGWVNIFEIGISNTMESVTGTDMVVTPEELNVPTNVSAAESSASKPNDEEHRLTIEDIIYNRVPLLDVDVFGDTAGGEVVEEGTPLYAIRSIVANWYVALRQVMLILALIFLIYIAIRMAISSVAEKKAVYKRMLVGWATSVILLFVIQYFMIFVVEINQMLVEIFENYSQNFANVDGNELTMYDTVRTRAYDIQFSTGWSGLIMYIVLVFMLVRFLWIYLKRYFTICILIIIAPIICAKYSLDKVKGRGGTSLKTWMYDFTMNVLIQTVHALVYTVLASVAINISSQSVAGFVFALVLLNFILQADKIFMKIFNFDKSKLSNDVTEKFNKTEQLAGFYWAMGTAKQFKSVGSGVVHGVAGAGHAFKELTIDNFMDARSQVTGEDQWNKWYNWRRQHIYDRLDNINDNVNNFMFDGNNEYLTARKLARQDTAAGKAAKKQLALAKKIKKKRYKQSMKDVRNTLTGGLGILAGIPLAVLDPSAGFLAITSGVNALRNVSSSNDNSYGHKLNKNKTFFDKHKHLRRVANVATLGGASLLQNEMRSSTGDKKKIQDKIPKKIGYIDRIQTSETELEEEYKRLQEEMQNEINNDASIADKEAELKARDDKLREALNNTKKRLSRKEIEVGVETFLANNDIESVKPNDIDQVLNLLQESLPDKVSITDEARHSIANELRKQIAANQADGASAKDTSKIIKGELNKFGAMDRGDNPDNKYKDIIEKAEELRDLADEARTETKESLVNANKIIKQVGKYKSGKRD